MKSIILQQREERDFLLAKPYQSRVVAEDASVYLKTQLIKLITGPRRAGKSVFALQILASENFAYLNFDDERLLNEFDEDVIVQLLMEVYPDFNYLLLDEIQNLNNWELWIGKLYRRGYNLVITGSNAKLLSSEIATVLTGRYLQIEILPFGFTEILSYKGFEVSMETPKKKAELLLHLDDYMTYGGFPETLLLREITRNYLSDLFDAILLKDVSKRYKVRRNEDLIRLSNYLLANYTNPFSFNELSNELNLGSVNTVQKYCGYLADTYLFFYLPRYNNKLKRMQKSPQKIYVVDTGFLLRSFQTSPNKGRMLENLVFIELIRRGFSTEQSIFYYRTKNDKEIDFVCRKGHQVDQLIQVSYDVSQTKTLERELAALVEASKELNCDNCLILTWDDAREIEYKELRINLKAVGEWLLDSEVVSS
ncbi:MAG: ATP-binding protein [Paludibacter sp.]|jgi:predicted AAA+ superfamily ATPase